MKIDPKFCPKCQRCKNPEAYMNNSVLNKHVVLRPKRKGKRMKRGTDPYLPSYQAKIKPTVSHKRIERERYRLSDEEKAISLRLFKTGESLMIAEGL
jgi:hypothetical protein